MAPQPGFQTAAVVRKAEPGANVEIRHDVEIPEPQSGQVLVKLECSGICHSDVHSIYNETPMETDIAGHEGVGRVVRLGPGVSDSFMDARVGVKWQYSTCGECEICAVNETACPNQNNSGRNVRGTFAQYIAAPAKDVTMLPAELKSEILAPLLCAGLAMYSSISKANLKPGEWLVLPGAGGGLGHLGVQIATRKGIKVIAIDSGEEKRELCLRLGAAAFLDFRKDDVEKEVMQLTNEVGAHAVVVTVGLTAAYVEGFKMLRRLGTLVCVGIPRTDFNLPISPFMMIVRCLKVVGSSGGTREEMDALLKMAVDGQVVPQVQVFELDEINEIVKKLANFEIGGRVVLKIPQ